MLLEHCAQVLSDALCLRMRSVYACCRHACSFIFAKQLLDVNFDHCLTNHLASKRYRRTCLLLFGQALVYCRIGSALLRLNCLVARLYGAVDLEVLFIKTGVRSQQLLGNGEGRRQSAKSVQGGCTAIQAILSEPRQCACRCQVK